MISKILKKIFGDYYFDLYYWYFFFRTKSNTRNNKKNILIINHFFDQDLEALQLKNNLYNLIVIDASVLRNVATQIFPSEVENYSFFNNNVNIIIKKRYKKIVYKFVKKLKNSLHISAVIAPSDNFFYVREIISVLHDFHIPYIVVDKEGTICPAYFTHFAAYIKNTCPLIADKILVWSERQKQFWIASGADQNKIEVVGQPRSDFWKDPKRWMKKTDLPILGLRPQSKMILFFTYDPWAYTPDYMIKKGKMHWDKLRNETHAVLYNFAKLHPEIDLVIKMHPQQLDKDEIQASIDSLKLQNVYLSSGSTISNQLIVHANCIIGFQSTAMIESMLTDKPIIYTFWGEARDRWSNDLIPLHKTEGVFVAESPVDLNRLMERCLSLFKLNSNTLQARKEFIDEYFYKVDGHAAERTLNAINNYLDSCE